MLGACLGYFQCQVSSTNDLLAYTMYFIAENQAHLIFRCYLKLVERQALCRLLDHYDSVAQGFELAHNVDRLLHIFPRNGFSGAQGSLVNFPMRGGARDPGKVYAITTKCVGCSKCGPYIVQAAHIVKENDNGNFFCQSKFTHRHPSQFFQLKLLHFRKLVVREQIQIVIATERAIIAFFGHMKLISLAMLVSFSIAQAQDQWKNVYIESAWTARDQWQKADVLIQSLALRSGSQVADIGCHEGYLTVKLSAVVGLEGKVYAVDIEQQKLDLLKQNLEKRQIKNVVPVKGEFNNSHLPSSLDAVVILDTYHEISKHDEILRHIKVALKPGGRLLICEPIADERRTSTRADQERKHELGMAFALEDLSKAGFTITRKSDPFLDRTKEKGDKMWMIVAKK